ncbi:MAG: hypothetical protein LBS46_06355 [Dysgonamonadaceae bacterium]|jgi:hypothetical protein|nr:hypothetical protein [Dysgonamonadaceae bacterium]
MIYIKNKKNKIENLQKKFPNALILDISSKGEQPWVQLSPFYPHGKIPIPPYRQDEEPKCFSQTVEGIWQGLKVFEGEDIDRSKFEITNMEGIKRTVRKFGKPLGHRYGIDGKELLDYQSARKEIYLRAYAWLLENKVENIIQALMYFAKRQDIVLLDYNTNEDIEDYSKPISHAGLVKRYLIKKYPELTSISFATPQPDTKGKKKKTATRKKKVQTSDNQQKLFN